MESCSNNGGAASAEPVRKLKDELERLLDELKRQREEHRIELEKLRVPAEDLESIKGKLLTQQSKLWSRKQEVKHKILNAQRLQAETLQKARAKEQQKRIIQAEIQQTKSRIIDYDRRLAQEAIQTRILTTQIAQLRTTLKNSIKVNLNW